jgi:hypothetical protein
VTRMEDSVTPKEVLADVAKAGSCRADEVNVGVIRAAPRSLGSMWLRCPLTAARKISGRGDVQSGGELNIGWLAARVSRLPTRRLQCFRSLCQKLLGAGIEMFGVRGLVIDRVAPNGVTSM